MNVVETKKLYRSCKDRILGGVAGGIGEYFEIDPTLIRLVIAFSFFACFGFFAYLLAWIIIPLDPTCVDPKTGAEEIKAHAERVANDIRNAVEQDVQGSAKHSEVVKSRRNNVRMWFGIILIFFAASILAENLFGIGLWHNFWPIILVALGVVMVAGSIERK
jgi:phage shock protein PspC (stress-responsive transcriptional regulator)